MQISKRDLVIGAASSLLMPSVAVALGGSPYDPFAFPEYPNPAQYGNRNTDGLTQAPTKIANRSRTKIGITIGQSNICSPCTTGYTVTQLQNHMFNIYDGATYLMQEPVIGMCESPPGNSGPNSRLGDNLITSAKCDRSIIAAIAIAGTLSADWAPGGVLNQRVIATCRRFAALGWVADYIIWHQGEQESGKGGVSAAQYTANVQGVCQTFRNYGQSGPMYVCLATNLNGAYRIPVRQGQQGCVSAALNILQGPDTDTIGPAYRQSDGLHFNGSGETILANMFTAIV